MELQGRYDDIKEQGLGLVAISYDSPDTLKRFADSRGITFPMISDGGSSIIKRYGLFNDQQQPGNRAYGVPHPGTFIVDRAGVVRSRFFEDAYQERYTAATILAAQGVSAGGTPVATATTAHLSVSVSATDPEVAPGERLSVMSTVTPARSIHVYAPGKHDYQVVKLVIDPQPWLRVHESVYPPSETYLFKPLNERVQVYTKRFRLSREITILATPDAQKQLASLQSLTIAGALDYQACNDTVCFNPARIPFSFTLALKRLVRQ